MARPSKNPAPAPGEIIDDESEQGTDPLASPAFGSDQPALTARRSFKTDALDDFEKLDDVLRGNDVSGGTVKIHRRAPNATRFAYIQEVPVEEFNMDWVRNVHGGGSYIFKLYGKNKRLHQDFPLEIDPRFRGSMDGPLPAAPIVAPADGKGNSDVLAIVMQMSNQTMAMMMEGQKTMATVLAAALGSRESNRQNEPVSELLTAATGLLQGRRETDPMAQMSTLLGVLREMKGLLPAGGDAPEKETMGDKILGLAGQALPPLVAMLANRGAQNQPPQMARAIPVPHAMPRAVHPDPVAPPAQAAPPSQADDPTLAYILSLPEPARVLLGQLRTLVPMIDACARNNTPVESCLDLLFVSIDEQSGNVLEGILGRPDWKAILFGNPNPQPADWYERLRAGFLASGAEDETSQSSDKSGIGGMPAYPDRT